MDVFLTLLPVLFWVLLIGGIIFFLVKKSKAKRRALEQRVTDLEAENTKVKEKI
ncbi:hypothetical protein [Alkalihalobacillus trypoxylicola]|uniref:hypothetical protein n=1 Tax=Alkalihalobacillus trypoxylicola TaxID=519424 RepID=UPI000AE7C0B1|nr:hypothetical protein [Alkalihalobacillus trypoxylicola]